jgi:prepilin-type processing-associated H-X9-DG protein
MKANSPNHAGDGQNVLYGDGHVDWVPTVFAGCPRPVSGAPRDNIYAFGPDVNAAAPSAGSYGAARDQYDSVILPTSDRGPQPKAPPPPAPAETTKAPAPVVPEASDPAAAAAPPVAPAAVAPHASTGVPPVWVAVGALGGMLVGAGAATAAFVIARRRVPPTP